MSRKALYTRKRYAVFPCFHCHQWQYSNMFQKTHKCVTCGYTLPLKAVQPTFETDEVGEAIQFLQNLKERIGLRRGMAEFVSADKLVRRRNTRT